MEGKIQHYYGLSNQHDVIVAKRIKIKFISFSPE